MDVKRSRISRCGSAWRDETDTIRAKKTQARRPVLIELRLFANRDEVL
jgi:hypothetical protein